MIPFDFVYYRPDSLSEAADIFTRIESEGKKGIYYSGGSEIISMCRAGDIRPDAVIDIKRILDCRAITRDEKELHIGSACTLNQISESKLFPLLRLSCGRIADHTNQCRITLGGNLCGTILYRETSLPLLICDAKITLFGAQGERTVPFESVFDGRMRLGPGEVVVKIHVPVWALSARHFHIKKTANEKIDYPLLSVAAVCKDNFLRTAFSGLCSYPFRSLPIESVLNDRTKPLEKRVLDACGLLPARVLSDVKGSGEYRLFILKNTLTKLLEDFENG